MSKFWSVQKQMLPLPSCKTLRHAHSRIVLSLVAEVTQEEGGTSMRLAMRRPLLCETTRGTIVRICVTVTQCHTLWHNDKWGPVSMSHSVILWQVGDISQSWDIVGGTGANKKNEWEGSVKRCIFSIRSILKHYKFACTHPKCTKQGGPGTQLAQLCHFEAIMIVTSC